MGYLHKPVLKDKEGRRNRYGEDVRKIKRAKSRVCKINNQRVSKNKGQKQKGLHQRTIQSTYYNWFEAAKRSKRCCFFDPSILALPIILKQNSVSLGLFTH